MWLGWADEMENEPRSFIVGLLHHKGGEGLTTSSPQVAWNWSRCVGVGDRRSLEAEGRRIVSEPGNACPTKQTNAKTVKFHFPLPQPTETFSLVKRVNVHWNPIGEAPGNPAAACLNVVPRQGLGKVLRIPKPTET